MNNESESIGHEMVIHARQIGEELKAITNGINRLLGHSLELLERSMDLGNSELRESLAIECLEARRLLATPTLGSLDQATSTLLRLQRALAAYGKELYPNPSGQDRWRELGGHEVPSHYV